MIAAVYSGRSGLSVQIAEADSGESALTQIADVDRQNCPYHLVFLDWVMPEVMGETILHRLQNMPLIFRPEIVVVSAYDSENIHALSASFGVRHFLTSPYSPRCSVG